MINVNILPRFMKISKCVKCKNPILYCRHVQSAIKQIDQLYNGYSYPNVQQASNALRRYYRTSSDEEKSTASLEEFRKQEHQREEEFEKQEREKKSSEDSEAEKTAKITALRLRILEAALQHVPTLGWSRDAIVQGAQELGYPSVVHGMFPEGGFALVSYFITKCNDELLKQMQTDAANRKADFNHLEFLVHFVRVRLEMLIPYKKQWPQALGLVASPQNVPTSLALLLTLVDDICYYSGDRSVDIGWYTRRIGLATVIKMTEFYLLQDDSPQHSKTWEFLKNRINELGQLHMIANQSENVTHTVQKSLSSAFITARNVLGLGHVRE